ncbi:MAG TPA: DoxX-like family protein [Gallionellaceae bacterium]
MTNDQIMRRSLAAVWLLTALASWHYPQAQRLALLQRTGLDGNAALAALYAGIALDALLGVLTLLDLRHLQKWLWLAQGLVIIAYSVIILLCLPEYALHPFGMLIKNLPILAMLWMLWRSEPPHKEDTHV